MPVIPVSAPLGFRPALSGLSAQACEVQAAEFRLLGLRAAVFHQVLKKKISSFHRGQKRKSLGFGVGDSFGGSVTEASLPLLMLDVEVV